MSAVTARLSGAISLMRRGGPHPPVGTFSHGFATGEAPKPEGRRHTLRAGLMFSSAHLRIGADRISS